MPNRVTHNELEVLIQSDANAERVTAVSAEVVCQANNNVERVTRVVLEVIVLADPITMGTAEITWWD